MTPEAPDAKPETPAVDTEETTGEQAPAPASSAAAARRREADEESARVRRTVIATIAALR